MLLSHTNAVTHNYQFTITPSSLNLLNIRIVFIKTATFKRYHLLEALPNIFVIVLHTASSTQ